MPRLVEEFPGFRPRWEKHLSFWKGEPAGGYNDISEFAQFVVKELYPGRRTEVLFGLQNKWISLAAGLFILAAPSGHASNIRMKIATI